MSCLLQALDGPLLHVNMISCASFSVFLSILICRGPNMSIAVLLNTGRPAAMFRVRKSEPNKKTKTKKQKNKKKQKTKNKKKTKKNQKKTKKTKKKTKT